MRAVQPEAGSGGCCPPAHQGPLLSVQDGVTLEYATDERVVRATHRVSLEVHSESERYVLLGPSGCGKSTLLEGGGRLHRAARGPHTSWHGAGRSPGPGPDRMVVFQEFDQLPPWKTVLGNVMPSRCCAARGLEQGALLAEGRALRGAGARSGLAAFAEAYPHQLSGGMKQRVAIARALAMRPQCAADGRALCRAGRADAPTHAGGTAGACGSRCASRCCS
jgi:NitT/TauT family transport system ATP-binding protein